MGKEHIYGSAFGFRTQESRVKPVHFATGFFLSLTERFYELRSLNKTVALKANKEMQDDYSTSGLIKLLKAEKRVRSDFDERSLHELRRHLHQVAHNDEAVYPVFEPYSGFGCDYSLVSAALVTNHKRNDGFAGYFVNQILMQSKEGQEVLKLARQWLESDASSLHRLLRPLLDSEDDAIEWENTYESKFGELDGTRLKRVSKMMAAQTNALLLLCRNVEQLAAPETRLRCLIIGTLVWLFQYLLREGGVSKQREIVQLMDFTDLPKSRMRAQSRWSFVRNREALLQSFDGFAKEGRFEDWKDEHKALAERSKYPFLDDIYREVALRSGIAKPRANAIPKHFELQPDTIRVLVLSTIPFGKVVSLSELSRKLADVWGIRFGGNADDAERLSDWGYVGLDQQEDLATNTQAFIGLLVGLGLAIAPADGLVLCSTHSESLT